MLVALSLWAGATTQTFAQDHLYLGYCDGQIADGNNGTVTGLTGNNTKITEAIRIPGSVLSGYAGLKIAGVHAGLANSSTLPSALTASLSKTKGGTNIKSATFSAPSSGWSDIMFDEPYVITGEENELWISFSFVQSKKLNVISFAGETSADGCWLANGNKYTDYSTKNWGSLPVEAIITGDNLPQHDLEVVSAKNIYTLTQMGSPIQTKVVIRNAALVEAVNPVVECKLNDQVVLAYNYQGTLQYRDKATLELEIPTDMITEEGEYPIEVSVKWSDDTVDDNQTNNTLTFLASVVEQVVLRVNVAEEGTGGWCGWCVRGLVGMKYMRETYPDRFIGIGVHNGDTYAVSAYDSWMGSQISGYPSAVFNRTGGAIDPAAATLESKLNSVDLYSDCYLELSANLLEDDPSKINMHLDASFLATQEDLDYNVAFVILEDSLPISQQNYYAGGSYGAMGGFESMGSPCNINIDDVARGIYPSVYGQSGVIPSNVVRGEVYSYDYQFTMPAIAHGDKVWAVVLLIDNKTKGIHQAAKCTSIGGLASGIQQVAAPNSADAVIYDLQGRCQTSSARGLLIRNGRVILVK